MVVIFTGGLPGGKISLPLELTKKYIFPAVVSSGSLPANSREAEKLDTLVRSISIPFQDGFVWFIQRRRNGEGRCIQADEDAKIYV